MRHAIFGSLVSALFGFQNVWLQLGCVACFLAEVLLSVVTKRQPVNKDARGQ